MVTEAGKIFIGTLIGVGLGVGIGALAFTHTGRQIAISAGRKAKIGIEKGLAKHSVRSRIKRTCIAKCKGSDDFDGCYDTCYESKTKRK